LSINCIGYRHHHEYLFQPLELHCAFKQILCTMGVACGQKAHAQCRTSPPRQAQRLGRFLGECSKKNLKCEVGINTMQISCKLGTFIRRGPVVVPIQRRPACCCVIITDGERGFACIVYSKLLPAKPSNNVRKVILRHRLQRLLSFTAQL
jgi:hypothetical protein